MRTLWRSRLNGTAARVYDAAVGKGKSPVKYVSFEPILRARHQANQDARRLMPPTKPRLSRKGVLISGKLPRLSGRW